ncbi:MAG: MCE family protein [Deltaproteobacteria bacterium]|nr:MCE family protein [Deltaproteobacteria bacterium]
MPKRIELKVGLFIVLTCIVIGIFFLYIAYKKDLFSTVYTYKLSSESAQGFSVGMPVLFSGFQIGKVQRLELNEEGFVQIFITVAEHQVKWLRKDSVFLLERPLIGSPRIVVYTDNMSSPVLSSDSVPNIFPVDSIDEAVQKVQRLLDKLTVIFTNVSSLSERFAAKESVLEMALGDEKSVAAIHLAVANAERLMARISEIAERFAAKQSLLEMALGDEKSVKAVHGTVTQTERLMARINETAERVDGITAEASIKILGQEGTVPLVNAILRDLVGKLKELDSVVAALPKVGSNIASSTDQLDRLRAEIDTALVTMNKVLQDLERLVPLSKEREILLP